MSADPVKVAVAWEAWDLYWQAASVGDGQAMARATRMMDELEPEVLAEMRERMESRRM